MSNRVLVFAPHPDDESFGCLGTLLRHKQLGDKIAFVWLTEASTKRGKEAKAGAMKVCKFFTAKGFFLGLPDQRLDTYPLNEIIAPLEAIVEAWKPTVAYIPFIGDLNRDHRITAEAAMIALRPYLPNAPKEVWMYEIKGTTELGLRQFQRDSTVSYDSYSKWTFLKSWYPNEIKNGRNKITDYECFEEWPRKALTL